MIENLSFLLLSQIQVFPNNLKRNFAFSEICGKDTAFALITSVFFYWDICLFHFISGLKTHKNGG